MDVTRWLLMVYLPILAPLVLLTLFTWPWKILGHSMRGLVKGVTHAWRGYSRSSHSHRRRPFSFWRNVFMGCWLELARQRDAQLGGGGSLLVVPHEHDHGGGGGLAPAFVDTLLEASNETRSRLHLELRTALLKFGVMAGFLFIVLVRPSHVPPTASAPVSSAGAGGVAVDLAGLFSGLGFLVAMSAAGVAAQLASLLNCAATPEQLYWFIVTWERALSGRQLAGAAVVVLSMAAGLAAAYQLYAPWVFIILLFVGATAYYAYLYFWSDSMWCPYKGAYVHFSQSFHREVLGVEALPARPSFCAFWELQPLLDIDVPGSTYDSMHRHLWRESQMAYYVSSSGGGAGPPTPLGPPSGTSATVQLAGSGRGGKQREASSPLPLRGTSGIVATTSTAAAPQEPGVEQGGGSSWPFMRYTGTNGSDAAPGGVTSSSSGNGSGSGGKLQGRLKKGGPASGLQVVSEAGGTYPASSSAAANAASLPL